MKVVSRRRKAVCGTGSGFNRHRRLRERPCDACYEAHRTGVNRPVVDVPTTAEMVVDVLSTYDRWLDAGLLVDLVRARHPDWVDDTIRRTAFRLSGAGVVERRVHPLTRLVEFRADMGAWDRLEEAS